MGFWDKVGEFAVKAGKFALEEAKSASERGKQYREEMHNKSDDQLFLIVKRERNSSPLKAGAAFQELKNRGHDAETIKILSS